MQGKVARKARRILTPSESSRRDIAQDFGVDPARMQVILLGVDDGFVPPTVPRVKGRILAMASADAPMKGIATLLEAFAKLRTERDVELVLVTKPTVGGLTERLVERLSIQDSVRFVHGISDAELVDLMGSAEVACVPSLYEGFSLPTAELMACETPLVVSRAGAIPEVVGPDGLCADLVTPGDVGSSSRPSRRCSTTTSGAHGWAPPAASGSRSCSRGAPSRPRPPGPTRTSSPTTRRSVMLTVDFDRLGLHPGERVLDMGCGAGRHAFEMYRRGADVIAFDQDADELSNVRELFAAMREAGEVPRVPRPTSRRAMRCRCRSPTASSTGSWPRRSSSTSPPTSRRSTSWCGRCAPAARIALTVPAGCRRSSAGSCPTTTTTPRAATSGSTPTRSWSPRPPTPGWSTTARTTRTGCTRRTGGSSAPSA